MSLTGHLAIKTFGTGLPMPVAVSLVGLADLFGIGLMLKRGHAEKPAQPALPAFAVPVVKSGLSARGGYVTSR